MDAKTVAAGIVQQFRIADQALSQITAGSGVIGREEGLELTVPDELIEALAQHPDGRGITRVESVVGRWVAHDLVRLTGQSIKMIVWSDARDATDREIERVRASNADSALIPLEVTSWGL